MFGKARNSDIEVVAVVLLDMSNKVDSVDKASFNRLPDLFPGWRVSSESQNITTPVFFCSLCQENALVFRR